MQRLRRESGARWSNTSELPQNSFAGIEVPEYDTYHRAAQDWFTKQLEGIIAPENLSDYTQQVGCETANTSRK